MPGVVSLFYQFFGCFLLQTRPMFPRLRQGWMAQGEKGSRVNEMVRASNRPII